MKLGLIGTGFMGKAHAFAYATAERVFDLPVAFERAVVADRTLDAAETARRQLGFDRATGDWRDLVADPHIELIDITTPNAVHLEMALAAIGAGKHVYCEKPLATTAKAARQMADAAEAAGIKTQVGFNYLANPMLHLTREMIEAGELGEIYAFRGIHAEDFLADPAGPWGFRHEPVGGGVLGDLGSHALATAEFLLGPLAAVMGECVTHVAERPGPDGELKPVRVEDAAHVLLRFENGATGSLVADWCASGSKMQHDFAVHGSKGGVRFTQERLNELEVYRADDPAGRRGFRRIEAGPEHGPYGRFCPAPAHQLGFNDLKAIEVAGFADALAGLAPEPYSFRMGWRIQALIEAVQASSREGQWRDTDTSALERLSA